jgi:isochorismate pyruvate lyase
MFTILLSRARSQAAIAAGADHSSTARAGSNKMKRPEACSTLAEVRAAIDQLDRDIIAALGTRLRYVRAAAAFKPTAEGVHVPDRVAAMLDQRRAWAIEGNLSPAVVADIFRTLVAYFTEEEVVHWQALHGLPE